MGCSARRTNPVIGSDSTITYEPKSSSDISVGITFFRKIGSRTGNLVGEGKIFTIKNGRNIRANVSIKNRFAYDDQKLMFHVVWVDTDGKSIHKKQIDLISGDTLTTISSAISISPDKRIPGNYSLRVYLFRELIAEKEFELLPAIESRKAITSDVIGSISFFGRKIKSTGKFLHKDSVFKLKKKKSIYAVVNLENTENHNKISLPFKIYWEDSKGKIIVII